MTETDERRIHAFRVAFLAALAWAGAQTLLCGFFLIGAIAESPPSGHIAAFDEGAVIAIWSVVAFGPLLVVCAAVAMWTVRLDLR